MAIASRSLLREVNSLELHQVNDLTPLLRWWPAGSASLTGSGHRPRGIPSMRGFFVRRGFSLAGTALRAGGRRHLLDSGAVKALELVFSP
jgi:hypothetical protein